MIMQLLDNKERVGGLLVLAFSLAYLRYALVLPLDPASGAVSFSARTLPVGLSATAILLSIVQLGMSFRQVGGERISESVRGFSWRPALLLVLLMGIYSIVFDVLGFIVASFLFLQLGFLILGERRVLMSAFISGFLVMFLWTMLTQAFGLYLDSGDLLRPLFG